MKSHSVKTRVCTKCKQRRSLVLFCYNWSIKRICKYCAGHLKQSK